MEVLDALRGAALYGVVVVNVATDFRTSLFAWLTHFHTSPRPLDRAADDVVALLFEQKAMTVFSWLFGVGLGIVRARAASRGVAPWPFLFRRYAVLFALGLAHLTLVWNGDILTSYALTALVVAPCLALPRRVTRALGVSLLAWWVLAPPTPLPFPSFAVMARDAADASSVYAHGTFRAALAFRLHEFRTCIAPLLASVFPRTAGLFLLGASLDVSRVSSWWRPWVVSACVVVGAGCTVADVLVAEGVLDLGRVRGQVGNAGSLLLATGGASCFLRAWQHPRLRRIAALLVPAGRMALTCYLAHSVVCVLLFQGVGLGLIDRVGAATAFLLATVLFVALSSWSAWWLRRHRFGPVERMWRVLTYGVDR